MRLVRAPKQLAGMLQAVKKINIKVVCYQEKQHLFCNAPAFKKGKSLPGNAVLQRRDDVIKYHDFKHVALNKRIPHQIYPKALPENGQPLTIRRLPLPGYNDYNP